MRNHHFDAIYVYVLCQLVSGDKGVKKQRLTIDSTEKHEWP
jgi:hypothetical protein